MTVTAPGGSRDAEKQNVVGHQPPHRERLRGEIPVFSELSIFLPCAAGRQGYAAGDLAGTKRRHTTAREPDRG